MSITVTKLAESKKALIESLQQTPRSLVEYEIKKYCTLPLEDSIVELKPKQTVCVEWVHGPTLTIANISIFDKTGIPLVEGEDIEFSGEKLTKWLIRYAKTGKNCNQKT